MTSTIPMISIEVVKICALPISRRKAGFPVEGDQGSAMLLLADEMHPNTRLTYALNGLILHGICITSCAPTLYHVLDRLHLPYCPWPDRGFTLVLRKRGLSLGTLAFLLMTSSLYETTGETMTEIRDAMETTGTKEER